MRAGALVWQEIHAGALVRQEIRVGLRGIFFQCADFRLIAVKNRISFWLPVVMTPKCLECLYRAYNYMIFVIIIHNYLENHSSETNYCKEYLPEIPFRNPDLQQTSNNLISVADFSVFDSKKSIKNRKSCRVTKL